MPFTPTPKQQEARRLLGGDATHCMLFGGSRSGKTFITVYAVVFRALAAPKSRHAIMRFRFNAVKTSVVLDTFPKVMELCFPEAKYRIDKTDYFAEFDNGSQIWFAGLDDKERTEKILGMEFATIYLNECSQIPFASRSMAITRLAQKCEWKTEQGAGTLRLKAYYDCNPPSQAHWTYKMFVQKREPETNEAAGNPGDFVSLQINPKDNEANLPAEYLATLAALPARMRLRFLDGKFGDVTSNALWTLENIETWRAGEKIPDMQRIIVAVDPSGSGDTDNLENDAIGIVVAGLGTDGNGYLLEDLTLKAGPAVWGKVAVNAFERWSADLVVAETNFGGAMVSFVVQAAKPGVSFKEVNASRGKVVRAEPVSLLAEKGKIRHVGRFNDLEDELCAFTTAGYLGGKSPNRADAYVWAFTELFPGLTRGAEKRPLDLSAPRKTLNLGHGDAGGAWMG
jgi:phage terminase large subunit-like protein